MTIDRVGTNSQSQLLLTQIQQAELALTKTQTQVTSGMVSTDYAGIGNKTAMLEATRSAANRTTAYQSATTLALNQSNLQDSQMSSLSDLANQLRQAITTAVGDNDASTLMTTAQSIFDQASQILNSKDGNGNYLYGGDKNGQPPLTATSLNDLISMSSASNAFQNGTVANSVMVGDGQSVQVGMLASNIGTGLMQTLKDLADFNAGSNGNFSTGLTDTQSSFLSGEIQTATTAATQINDAAAANGNINSQLTDASANQKTMSTLFGGFVSNIEEVDMPTAITQLNQNQVALQAALQVTSQLSQVSLLNYLPAPAA
ncbi:MAG TPA: flagellin [Rhizomicrobium sp.]|jgi:flagellar hook-associated protein 3 FlgL